MHLDHRLGYVSWPPHSWDTLTAQGKGGSRPIPASLPRDCPWEMIAGILYTESGDLGEEWICLTVLPVHWGLDILASLDFVVAMISQSEFSFPIQQSCTIHRPT